MTGKRAGWTWWAAYALFATFVFLPGPKRNPFSGLPMATKPQAVFLALLVAGLFCLFSRRASAPAFAGW